MKRSLVSILVLLVAVALPALGQDQKMSPEQKAMMDAWMAYMTPGAAHHALDPMVGTFDVKVTAWMAPGAPPSFSGGTSTNHWILGNRYVEQDFTGTFNGMPFNGIGFTGYDNAKKEYVGTWMDNMGTGLMMSTGTTADGKSFSFNSMSTNPVNGKDMTGQTKVTVLDADHHNFEMWSPGPDGKMYKMMEIDYSRRK